MSLVKVVVDGVAVEVPAGTLVIEAAKRARVEIPHFCYHPRLVPIAACRLCLVEIEGVRGLQPSCATPAKDGMIVKTATSAAEASHAEVLGNVLSYHPLDCPKCERAGCCLLEDFSYAHAPAKLPIYRPPGLEGEDYVSAPWGPLLVYDPYKCVKCYRCVRWCDEVEDCRAIGTQGRGHEIVIATVGQGPLACDYCGGCASVCPTGAITSKAGRFVAKDWEYRNEASPCAYCANGCSLVLRTWKGKVAKVDDAAYLASAGRPVEAADPNRGSLCAKGRYGFDALYASGRLDRPMVRRDGRLEPVSWDVAIRAAAAGIRRTAARPGELAAIASGRLGAEDLYMLGRLVRAAGRSNALRLHGGAAERLGHLKDRTGVAGTTAPQSAVRDHDLFVVCDVDLPSEAPVLAQDLLEAVRLRGAGLVRIGECGARLAARGETAPRLGAALDRLRAARRPAVVVSAERAPIGLLDEVVEALGERGDWGAGGAALYAVSLRAGSQGAADVGFTPNHLPGYRPLDDGAAWNRWGLAAGRPEAAEPRALVVAGVDSAAIPFDVEFLVVSDLYRTETAEKADVVLPAAALYEKEATMVDLFGLPQRSCAAAAAPGDARPDWWIWASLSIALGRPAPGTLAEIRREIAEVCPEVLAPRIFPERVRVRPAAPPPFLGDPLPREGLFESGRLARRSRWLDVIRRQNAGEPIPPEEARAASLGGFAEREAEGPAGDDFRRALDGLAARPRAEAPR